MISVIMSVYNGEKTVARAVTSILEGTYSDLEFIIVDDGSTDNTLQILLQLAEKDKRIRLLTNEKNMGISYSLNRAIEVAEGEYVARQDADDFSYPNRLEVQLGYLQGREDISFVGTAARLVDEDRRTWGTRYYPITIDKKTIVKYNPYIHPTLLFKSVAIKAVGGYTDAPYTVRCEDYDLIFRLYAKGFKGENIPKIYLEYFESLNSATRHNKQTRLNEYKVRKLGVKAINGGLIGRIYTLKPLLLLYLDNKTYNKAHNKKWKDNAEDTEN